LGIDLTDVHSSTISGNDASGNSAFGMSAGENVSGLGPLGTVSHNIFNGNGVDGLLVAAFSGATIQHNVAIGNGTFGIVLGGAMTGPSDVTNNTSLANGNFDLFDTTPNCTGHGWSGNTFFTANQTCIH
jgi:parallel beta-helix repeat protein